MTRRYFLAGKEISLPEYPAATMSDHPAVFNGALDSKDPLLAESLRAAKVLLRESFIVLYDDGSAAVYRIKGNLSEPCCENFIHQWFESFGGAGRELHPYQFCPMCGKNLLRYVEERYETNQKA